MRISKQQALQLYQEGSLPELSERADKLCNVTRASRPHTSQNSHPGNVRTYVVERNINYTNICCCRCSFCAFSASPGGKNGFVLGFDEIAEKIEELLSIGGTQILLQGGLNPELSFSWYEELLGQIKKRFPRLHTHAFSPPEICFMAERFNMTIPEVIERLRSAGLDTIPGGGAEILVERVRKIISPGKCSTEQWLDVMRQAHKLGMCTTATMMFGHVETPAERIEHLDRLRTLQDESLERRESNPSAGYFTAFTCWPFQPGSTRLGRLDRYDPIRDRDRDQPRRPDQLLLAGAFEQLKMTALARIYLDNIPNIQASWVTQGPKIAQLSLLAGCNDIGSLMMEENVVSAAGTTFRMQLAELRQLIQTAGFQPVQRDYYYNLLL
ncbi:MAG: dehypoxanthine futalosine cyclase [Sedimentisphaerales bacterium]|nr:dehypoxanthine futalosine cyclase [Sedimentisphaerales bacterium]